MIHTLSEEFGIDIAHCQYVIVCFHKETRRICATMDYAAQNWAEGDYHYERVREVKVTNSKSSYVVLLRNEECSDARLRVLCSTSVAGNKPPKTFSRFSQVYKELGIKLLTTSNTLR